MGLAVTLAHLVAKCAAANYGTQIEERGEKGEKEGGYPA